MVRAKFTLVAFTAGGHAGIQPFHSALPPMRTKPPLLFNQSVGKPS
jgi:hypothetical protein